MKNTISFCALGGLSSVGQNMYLYKYNNKFLVVDCGVGFLEEDIGVGDIKYPDTSYLEKYKKDVVGFVITHGHEDHIGALKYIWPKFRKPIYCTRFVAEIIERTFKGIDISFNPKKDIIIFNHLGDSFNIKPFEIETFHVSHSVPEANMLIIKTEAGKILHTGDWTFNDGINIEKNTDYKKLKEIGKSKDLLALVVDSTATKRIHPQIMETEVSDSLYKIMKEAKGRVFVSGYSRSLARIKSFSTASRKAGRIPAIKERSSNASVPYVGLPEFRDIAIKFGYLDKEEVFFHKEIKDLPASKQAIFLTGSQGEKFAMLTRLCRNEVKELKLTSDDTVVFSSLIIPGREKEVSFLYNTLAKMGIKTYTIFDTDNLHASGHAGKPEFEKFYKMIKADTIIPMHGEEMAEILNMKIALENKSVKYSIMPKNGDVVILEKGKEPYISDNIPTGFVIMEGNTERNQKDKALKNRKKVGLNGAIFITLQLDKKGFIKQEPTLSSVGLIEGNNDKLKKEIIQNIIKMMKKLNKNERKNNNIIINNIELSVKNIIKSAFGKDKKPFIITHLISK